MKNFKYVAVSAGILCLCLIMSGCSTLPKTTAECAGLYTDKVEITKCEGYVIHKEDSQHKRRMEELEKENCHYPAIWVGRGRWSGYCRRIYN